MVSTFASLRRCGGLLAVLLDVPLLRRRLPSAQAETGAPADLAQTVAEAMAAVEQGDTAAAHSALERLLAFLDGLAGRYLYGAQG